MGEKYLSFPGHILKEKRETLGFSHSDITKHLSIPVDMVLALESGDITTIHHLSYTTGFLRSYCNFIGIEPETMVAALQQQSKSKNNTQRSATRSTFQLKLPQLQMPSIIHSIPSELVAWVSITLLVGLGWFTYNTFSPDHTYSNDNKTNAAEIDLRPPTPRSARNR